MIIEKRATSTTPLLDLDSPTSSNAIAGPSITPSLDAALIPSGPSGKDAEANERSIPNVLEGIDFPVPAGGEEPPPEFTPYEAEHFATSSGDIISHDKHLNEDGAY